MRTALDFTLTYLPDAEVQSSIGPLKWLCGTEGLSVAYEYYIDSPFGSSRLWAERSIRGRRSLPVMAAEDRVEAGSIDGRPAIFVHPADDESGLGQGWIIVIEDDAGPKFTVLILTADNGVPFSELVKIAEGAKP